MLLLYCLERVSPYLDSHVSICEDHVELVICHAKLFPQLCDQILVHQVLLTKTPHRLVILWRKEDTLVRFNDIIFVYSY